MQLLMQSNPPFELPSPCLFTLNVQKFYSILSNNLSMQDSIVLAFGTPSYSSFPYAAKLLRGNDGPQNRARDKGHLSRSSRSCKSAFIRVHPFDNPWMGRVTSHFCEHSSFPSRISLPSPHSSPSPVPITPFRT